MATRKPVKKTVVRKVVVRKATAKVTRKAKAAPVNATVAHKVVLAGLGAAERAQGEAMKVYGVIARETERLNAMTTQAAQALAKKANLFVREGQEIQSKVQAAAEAKAREVAKEVKAFAAKSEKTFKKGLHGSVNTTAANAKEGITRLEQVFEARVAKTLNTFGIPSAQNVRELQARMSDLQKALVQLNKRGVRA
jgi:hypothetical protein